MTKPVLATNIAALRNFMGLNQTEFGERLGVVQSYVSKWERGVEPSGVPLATMAEWAGVSVSTFSKEPWSPPKVADQLPTRSADGGETVGITSLDLSVSMGPGTLIEDFVESEPVQFDIAFLRAFTHAPFDRLRLIRGIGTSMEPVFMSSSRFLIDTTDRGSRLDGYYWISIEGAHGLKRLNPAGDGKWWIISENPGVDNYTIDRRAVRIEGRAVWVSRGL